MKKWNHYVCNKCGLTTIARHDDEGVTPFMIGCKAKPACFGTAESRFFDGPQDDAQQPHVVFFRPSADKAIEWINDRPKKHRAWLLDHYQRGGALMRDADATIQPTTKE